MKSMTGYGRGKLEENNREYEIEIKSVNHKYNDISIKLPRTIGYLEENIKKEIQKNISRGKIDVFVNFANYSKDGKNIKINNELAEIYIEELKKLAKNTGITENITVTEISKFPDVLIIQNTDEEEKVIWNELNKCLQVAINNFISARITEGEKIKLDLENRINDIQEKTEKIATYSTGLVEEYIVKLEARIKEILKTDIIDQNRLAQEVVIYSDKVSVEEELTRLRSHISQFKELINLDIPTGKKLDFLVQEMNRETNTMGSKSGSLDITNLVVDIKTQIENIREQIQNIE